MRAARAAPSAMGPKEDGSSELIERARHDFLYDAEKGEWGIFLG